MKRLTLTEQEFKATVGGEKTSHKMEGSLKVLHNISDYWNVEVSSKNWFYFYHDNDDETTEFFHLKPPFKIGETVYLAEPFNAKNRTVYYKYDHVGYITTGWKSAILMCEFYARHFIKITKITVEHGIKWQWVIEFELLK